MAQVSERAAAGTGRRKLVLIGFMGSGKSRAARLLAERLGVEALDSDTLIEKRLDKSISAIFEEGGESAFREREKAIVLELLDRDDARVVALGGGAVKSPDVVQRLGDHVCVYLDVSTDMAWKRAHKDDDRPLARDHEQFVALHEERIPLYESVARAVVPVEGWDLDERALDAASALTSDLVPSTVRMVWASVPGTGYPVYVGRGALDAAGVLWPRGERSFAVADDTVWKLYGERLERALEAGPGLHGVVSVPAGEASKSLGQSERVLSALARAGMERSDALVALGGGVAGDLGGFCAGVYQRGVPVVQVPTTLVAQVDSAYGGKTGVDLPEAKNYAGVFHQPAAVFTDPEVLSSLPAGELRAGFVEVVKTALIAGEPLWEEVQRIGSAERISDAVIESCLRTKLRVVARDERDLGARASLNLGHTFAHALEAATGYGAYRHGEAVAIGLLVALRLSERELGLDPAVRETVAMLLRDNGLPVGFEGVSTADVLARTALDKKRSGGRIGFVLLRAPGDVVTHSEVDDALVRTAIDEVRAR
jgi:shikimate kinase/3-dehydroquinate synthase